MLIPESKWAVVKVLEYRDGSIYKVEVVSEVWIGLDYLDLSFNDQVAHLNTIAQEHGGDYLDPPVDDGTPTYRSRKL